MTDAIAGVDLLGLAAAHLEEAVVVVDAAGGLVLANAAGRRLWGLGTARAGNPVRPSVEVHTPDGAPTDLPFARASRAEHGIRDLAVGGGAF